MVITIPVYLNHSWTVCLQMVVSKIVVITMGYFHFLISHN